jgi:hypothetical protein
VKMTDFLFSGLASFSHLLKSRHEDWRRRRRVHARGRHKCTASVPIRQIVCHRRSRVPVERPFNDADNASHLASGICHLKLTYAPFGCEGLIERETSMRASADAPFKKRCRLLSRSTPCRVCSSESLGILQ